MQNRIIGQKISILCSGLAQCGSEITHDQTESRGCWPTNHHPPGRLIKVHETHHNTVIHYNNIDFDSWNTDGDLDSEVEKGLTMVGVCVLVRMCN